MPDENRFRPDAILRPARGDRVHLCKATGGEYTGRYTEVNSVMNSANLQRGHYFIWSNNDLAYEIYYDVTAREWREVKPAPRPQRPPAA